MVWRRLSVPVAWILGLLTIAAAVLRNWHDWAAVPFWLDDLGAGALLIGAALFSSKEQDNLRGRLMTGAMGIAIAVLWGSMFEDVANVRASPEAWTVMPAVAFALTGAAFALALTGFGLSLPSKRRPFVGTRPDKPKNRR